MLLDMCKGKIHRATVTDTHLDYQGSITIDAALMEAAGILPGEKVQVANLRDGCRFETYTIVGERGKGEICINGAAAHRAEAGDKVIIICYALMTEDEARTHTPKIVHVDEDNRITD
jgi:aspartate 1-decarboxylase